MFTCLLITCLPIIHSSIMVVKCLKSYLYCFPETASIFGIHTDLYIGIIFLYRLTCFHLMCYHLSCCLLSPARYYPCHAITCHATTWHLPLLSYHLSLATCHINTRPVIITFTGTLYLLSCIIYTVTRIYNTHVILLCMYYCTPYFLIMSCSCYSRKLKLYNKS